MEFAPQEFGAAIATVGTHVLDAAALAQPVWLLVALLLHSASILCRVRVWQQLLRAALPRQEVAFRAALGPYLASVAANVVAPLRGGDAVRIALARRTLPEASSAAVLGTLAAEAVPGVIIVPLLCIAALCLGVLPISPMIVAGVTLGGLAVTFAAWRLLRPLRNRATGFLAELGSGLRLLGTPGRYARTVGPLTLLDWGLRIAMVTTLLAAFHLGLDAAAGVAVVSIDSITTLLPILPNGAGAQQAAIAGALHTHAPTATLIAFSAGTQVLISALNAVTGAVAFTSLRRPAHASRKPSLASAVSN